MSDKELRQEMIDDIQAIAEKLGSNTVPRHEFLRHSGISERKVSVEFESYNGLVEAAGLTVNM